MAEVEKIVGGFRSVIQDFVVPELKAIQVEIRHLAEQSAKQEQRLETLHREMDGRFLKVDERFEALHQEMEGRFLKVDERLETLHREMDARFLRVDERFEEILKNIHHVLQGQERILAKLEYSERVSELEKRFERLEALVRSKLAVGLES